MEEAEKSMKQEAAEAEKAEEKQAEKNAEITAAADEKLPEDTAAERAPAAADVPESGAGETAQEEPKPVRYTWWERLRNAIQLPSFLQDKKPPMLYLHAAEDEQDQYRGIYWLDTIYYGGEKYDILASKQEMEKEEAGETMICRVEDDPDDPESVVYLPEENEQVLRAVFAIFRDRKKNRYEFVDVPEEEADGENL